MRERQDSPFKIIVMGPAGAGKTTILRELGDQGIPVFPEPDNPAFDTLLEGIRRGRPEQLHFASQLSKMAQLMSSELASGLSAAPVVVVESSVLATQVYNRLFRERKYISRDQFATLEAVDRHYRRRISPDSTLIVYLNADIATLEDRTLRRDGVVANDYKAQAHYWQELLRDLRRSRFPLCIIDTSQDRPEETAAKVLQRVKDMSKKL